MKPRDAKTLDEICKLNRDNYDVPEGWMIIEEGEVSLINQKTGENATGQVTFSRKSFAKLIDWYNREQKLRASP